MFDSVYNKQHKKYVYSEHHTDIPSSIYTNNSDIYMRKKKYNSLIKKALYIIILSQNIFHQNEKFGIFLFPYEFNKIISV